MQTITLVSTLPPLKGLSAYTLELCKALAAVRKIDFIGFKRLYPEFLYPGGTVDAAARPVQIRNMNQRAFLTWYNPLTWVWGGLTARGDAVHAQWWSHVLAPVFFVLLALARLRGKIIVLTVHNVLPHERSGLNDFLNRSVIKLAHRLVVHSEINKKTLCGRYEIEENRVFVIPHGILKPAGLTDMTREDARERLGLETGHRVVLAFGNIRDYKGVDVLIKAFRNIKLDDARLVIAGKCWENRRKYLSIINGDPRIMFVDNFVPSNEVAVYFRAADIVALPYKYFESASGVGAMALPYHLPMIVSCVGSLPDLVIDKANCVVEPGSVDELRSKIERILRDDQLRAKLGEEARSVEHEYGWGRIAERTIEVYEGSKATRKR